MCYYQSIFLSILQRHRSYGPTCGVTVFIEGNGHDFKSYFRLCAFHFEQMLLLPLYLDKIVKQNGLFRIRMTTGLAERNVCFQITCHHHHQVALLARISLHSNRPSLWTFACWPTLARTCVKVQRRTFLMSSFWLLQPYLACLVRPTWIILVGLVWFVKFYGISMFVGY